MNDEDTRATARGFASRAAAVLLNHDLSAYQPIPMHADLARCREWLDACCEKHESCNSTSKTLAYEGYKTLIKLIDVNKRCVVSFPSKGGIEYATLSYVCGPGYSLCVLQGSNTWTHNAQGHLQHPLPDAMPATIEDSLSVTRALQIQYLWIDSICIAQDDEVEKQIQIQAMFNIYNDSKLCIVSASGIDSHTPFPGVSNPREAGPFRKVDIKDNLTLGLPYPALGTMLKNYRYMERA